MNQRVSGRNRGARLRFGCHARMNGKLMGCEIFFQAGFGAWGGPVREIQLDLVRHGAL